MPAIFDNIERSLVATLNTSLELSNHADFCVGYFNLRGWKQIDEKIERFTGAENGRCRLLIGMPVSPAAEIQEFLSATKGDRIDQQEAIRQKKKLAEMLRNQLCCGVPSNEDEKGLQRLLHQLRNGKVQVKLFLHHRLHAKLYLCYRDDPVNPIMGFLGSSNLTFSGLGHQGELNVDVLEQDAALKLKDWFQDRWEDSFCYDITKDLIDVIAESWAREDLIPPYYIYLKIAYELSQDARTGIAEEVLPERFEKVLFQFQKEAVKIAAHHINKHGGVLIGDVVGLGKTITATAVASIFQDTCRILVICPKNLVDMWKDYAHYYNVNMTVRSISMSHRLEEEKRYHLLVIDESHNLRNRESKRYKQVREYIEKNDSKVMMLSATPYNKTFVDLANQLRLFLDENEDIGIAPEKFIREKGVVELDRHECQRRSIKAFELSEHPDDWRELMRLYLVRRTHSFIKENYARKDGERNRQYLIFPSGERSYFPAREPHTIKFKIDENDPDDQYAQLYSEHVVDTVNDLQLPRYGLGNYIDENPKQSPTPKEAEIIKDLARAGKRLLGFCRTGLFKRLESSGNVFLRSLERHVLRNYVYIHACENNEPIPIGSQDVEFLDTRFSDEDEDFDLGEKAADDSYLQKEADYRKHAEAIYSQYRRHGKSHFKWIASNHFKDTLATHLESDSKRLIGLIRKYGDWNPEKDEKLNRLKTLLSDRHSDEKILIFTQFADTAHYLREQLVRSDIEKTECVTGDTANPTKIVQRFSPASNVRAVPEEEQLRILVSTDVLSEGQNLQDANIILNYDLPWAIIRLIQRAGRVDRIGQKHDSILCYSFLPAEGVEKIIKLRSRVKRRLTQNAEVIGSDEAFFEDQEDVGTLKNLYNEKSGILDGDQDAEVDMASEAFQIWKDAVDKDPKLAKAIPDLPNVIYSARSWRPQPDMPDGALVFLKTSEDNCALAWMDQEGNSATESQYKILKAAKCAPDTPALEKAENHHELVKKGVDLIIEENRSIGGTLGSRRGARFRIYEKLKLYLEDVKDELFDTESLRRAHQQIYEAPLTEKAKNIINTHLRQKASLQKLAEVVQSLYKENELCVEQHAAGKREPQLICSLGLIENKNRTGVPPVKKRGGNTG